MDEADLRYLSQIKLIRVPGFQCPVWDTHFEIAGYYVTENLLHHMGARRFSCCRPYNYMMQQFAFKYFLTGSTAEDVSALLTIPPSTARDYFHNFCAYIKML